MLHRERGNTLYHLRSVVRPLQRSSDRVLRGLRDQCASAASTYPVVRRSSSVSISFEFHRVLLRASCDGITPHRSASFQARKITKRTDEVRGALHQQSSELLGACISLQSTRCGVMQLGFSDTFRLNRIGQDVDDATSAYCRSSHAVHAPDRCQYGKECVSMLR
jgi:hypothetical protein